MNQTAPGRRLLNRLTAEIVTWLEPPDPDRVPDTLSTWDKATWQAAELVVSMQGLGPCLHDALPRTSIYAALPDSFRLWLAAQHEMNGERVQRLHADLVTILRQANQAGITVMPLKGSLLSIRYYASPALRPMADLDLLIRPEDESALTAILEAMGYRFKPPRSAHAQVREFINPDGHRIVSGHGDHPDNPRPVEVHVDLKKSLWPDVAAYDLTDYVWAGSREAELLGERVWVPAPERFLTYLATHATHHHLFQSGRFVHLLDLAYVAPEVQTLDPPDPNWVYPALRLAARGLPRCFAGVDQLALAQGTLPGLRRWAESVPLDGRCGLNLALTPRDRQNQWQLRWLRWHPTPPRLALGYGHTPLPLAYVRHLFTILHHLKRRAWPRPEA